MHGVREPGIRHRNSRLHDLPEPVIRRDFPPDVDLLGTQTPSRERLGSESCPEDESVGAWIARGNSEREGVGLEHGLAALRPGPECENGNSRPKDEMAPVDGHTTYYIRGGQP